jgi:hypothetical protein
MAMIYTLMNDGYKLDGWYMCFTLDTDHDIAKERFVQRFKTEPEEVFEYKHLLWVGPISREEFPIFPEKR